MKITHSRGLLTALVLSLSLASCGQHSLGTPVQSSSSNIRAQESTDSYSPDLSTFELDDPNYTGTVDYVPEEPSESFELSRQAKLGDLVYPADAQTTGISNDLYQTPLQAQGWGTTSCDQHAVISNFGMGDGYVSGQTDPISRTFAWGFYIFRAHKMKYQSFNVWVYQNGRLVDSKIRYSYEPHASLSGRSLRKGDNIRILAEARGTYGRTSYVTGIQFNCTVTR